jgi:acyl-CoA hydrolase/GNAT superfamily N-acetyltransferase
MPGTRRKFLRGVKDWKTRYDRIKTTAHEAIRQIKRGDRIFIGTACGEPQALVKALIDSQSGIEDAEIYHLLTLGVAAYTEPKFSTQFRHNSFFIGPSTRDAVWEGRADYIPIMLSDIPRLIREKRHPIDTALIQVSPPDEHGFCTFGVSVDITKAAAETARLVIGQVNRMMPRTLGDSFIHVTDIDVIVEHDEPILEWTYPPPQEVHFQVAHNVAKLIQNGDTLQMGVGSIPNVALAELQDRLDLGIHTEVFSDGVMDLIEAGAVTCTKKTIHPGKIITSFAMGTRKLYDYIDNNPFFEFHPTEYCNHPSVISRNDRLAAINVALEVDLTGQVNADSIGYRFYSGIGGQSDFIRGAALSHRGKPIIALPSTTSDGKISRIVAKLSDGAGVVTTRGDVHYVVTEYGIAFLHGKNIRERAMTLISVAHPDVRGELLDFAKDKKYIYADQILPPASGVVYPEEIETTYVSPGQGNLFVRPLRPTDEGLLREMFYDLSERSVYLRFFSPLKSMPHEKAQLLVNLDYREQMAIGAFTGEEPDWRMVGLGQYMLDRKTNMAEAAVVVLDSWHGQGLGTYLFNYLVRIARQRGVEGFTAEVLSENRAMLHIVQKSGYVMATRFEDGVYLLDIRFEQAKPASCRTEDTPRDGQLKP